MLRLPPRSSLRAITRLVTWRSGTWSPARSRRLATSPASSDGPQMRPTGLGHGVYKDSIDYGVFCGEWCIGRIYENRSGPEGSELVLGAAPPQPNRNPAHL